MNIKKAIYIPLIIGILIGSATVWSGALAVCKVVVDDGSSGWMVSIPSVNYCNYLWSYNENGSDQKNKANAFSTLASSGNADYHFNEQEKDTMKKVSPCLKHFFSGAQTPSEAQEPSLTALL